MKRILVINAKDNVGVLLENAKEGDKCNYNNREVTMLEDIEFGHKVALNDIAEGEIVYKYGEEIGFALKDIAAGMWIHHHNMGCRRGK